MNLYIVVPCYNEEEVLLETTKRLADKLNRMTKEGLISKDSRVLYVDDGSRDKTWELIEQFHSQSEVITGLKLSRNCGHQNALLAGLMTAREYADAVVSMDADLQDDIEVLDEFVKEYKNGAEIVFGVRKNRKTDTLFKRNTAQGFYKMMNFLGAEIIYNHADYRLMGKRALSELAKYKEVNLFLRGIVTNLGFKTAVVEYERAERFAGKTKYPLKKMLSFASDGVTSFSVKPLKAITAFGTAVSFISFIFLVYIFINALIGNPSYVSGWASTAVLISFFGGCQILAIGIVGEYISKIYLETKERPRYIIEKELKG